MLCARMLSQKKEGEQSRFYKASERVFERVIAFYGRTLEWVLARQTMTLLIAAGTLVLTVLLYLVVPKGFFPVQDTGEIQGVTEAGQSVSFAQMAQSQQRIARTILRDPAVESLSSFIGVDGTNTTLNSGRIQINLKALKERRGVAGLGCHPAPAEGARESRRHHRSTCSRSQDISVEDIVSRTEFQYTLEDPNAGRTRRGTPTDFVKRLKRAA